MKQTTRSPESPARGVLPLALLLTLALGVLDAPTARALAAEPVRASALLQAAFGSQGEASCRDTTGDLCPRAASEPGAHAGRLNPDAPGGPRRACRRGERGLAPPSRTHA